MMFLPYHFIINLSSLHFKPIYSLMSTANKKASDFCFLNDSSVIATVGNIYCSL